MRSKDTTREVLVALTTGLVLIACGDDPEDKNLEQAAVMLQDCGKADCGTAMGVAYFQCPDSTFAGPVCGRDEDGACGWRVVTCADESPGTEGSADDTRDDAADQSTDLATEDHQDTQDDNSAANTDETTGQRRICGESECGPRPDGDNELCQDGGLGGPLCVRDEGGQCGWTIVECPPYDLTRCGKADCPHPLGMPNWECADGRIGGPSCVRDSDGTCGWQVVNCS